MSDQSTARNDQDYAVFPLHTVMFPGCAIRLRIFEQRYLRMVSETSQADLPFVIALIRDQAGQRTSEVGEASTCYSTACLARISDFNQGTDGVLDLVVRAGTRVQIVNSYHEPDSLMRASLDSFTENELMDLPLSYTGLKSIFDSLKRQDPFLLNEDSSMLSATELSFFLAHLAPLPRNKKQKLLEMDNTESRLKALQETFSAMRFTLTA